MKKIMNFKNIVLLVALTMFGVIFFSLVNNINIEKSTPYYYEDTRNDEQKEMEGGYFADESGNIIQPNQEEIGDLSERVVTIKKAEKVIQKTIPGRYRMHEHFEFNDGIPTGHGNLYFYQAGETIPDHWGNYEQSIVSWDPSQLKYSDTENYNQDRNLGVYHMKSSLYMNWVDITPPTKGTWEGSHYAFISNPTNNKPTLVNENLTSINADHNENNGSISYSVNVKDADDYYRNYGVSINGGPIEVLESNQEMDRTIRTDTEKWKNDDPITGKHVDFDINKTFDNIGAGTHSIQLHGQAHVGDMYMGWETIGSPRSKTIDTNSDAPSDPSVTNISEIAKPLPNGGNEGEIKLNGNYKFANNNTNYKVTNLEVSKNDGLSWEGADIWSGISNTWQHTFKVLTAGTYNFKVKLTHNGYPTAPVISTIPYSHNLIEISPPGGPFNNNYIPANHFKASEGEANGEINFSGDYKDDNQLVNKVETVMSFDNGNTWENPKIVDNDENIANRFDTRLIGIPEGQVLTKVRLTYESGPGQGGAATIESTPSSFIMGVHKDPLLDEINSPMTLTPIEADYNTTNESSMRLQVILHDPDDQIELVQVKHQIPGVTNWVIENYLHFTTLPNGNKEVDYIIPNLQSKKDYDFKMNVRLKRTMNWREGYIKTGVSTTMEIPIEAVTTIGVGTEPSKWGMNDGKVPGTVTVPSPTNNSSVTGVKAYLKKTNDSSYSYLYGGAISTNGTTNIEFVGNNPNPIIASNDYYIEIVYDWKSNSGLTYPFIKTSGTTSVPVGRDFPPEVQINSTNSIAPTKWGLSNGKIQFNYKVINNHNASIQNYTVKLYDAQGAFIPGKEVIETNPTPTNYAGEFIGLEAGNYTIKIFSDYTLNGNIIPTTELTSKAITIINGIEAKPELYVQNLSSTKPTKWGLSDGKIHFEYSTINLYNADLTKATFKIYDILGNELDTKTINNPAASGTSEFIGLPTATYQVKAFMTYQINSDATVVEEFTNQKTIAIGDGDDFPLTAEITNIKTKDVTFLGAEDGEISFDYEVINIYNSDVSEVKIVIENEQGVPIEKREKDITSEAIWTRSEEFKFLGAGIYRMKILSTYEINESGIVTNETLFDSGAFRIAADNFIQPSSTHTIAIAPYKINVITNIKDASNVIVRETLIITIKVNGEVKYEGNEMNVYIHYNENDIIWYDIGVQADIELPDGRVARWDGNNILEKVDHQPINEENNTTTILISIIISLIIMFILSLVLIKKIPSIKQRFLR